MTQLTPKKITKLLRADTQNVSRDPTLMFAICLNIIAPCAFLMWQSDIDQAAQAAFGLADFHRFMIPALLLLPVFLTGWVTGFLLLDDRDDGPLIALDVTPLGKAGFFGYRATITALITFMVVLATSIAIIPETDPALQVLIAGLAALQAVCVAFALPAIARNKVEGLAITKLLNLAMFVPYLSLFPSPARYLAGIVPTYWVSELLLLPTEHYLPFPVVIVLAVIAHGFTAVLIFRLATHRIG